MAKMNTENTVESRIIAVVDTFSAVYYNEDIKGFALYHRAFNFYCHIGGVEMATSSITKEFVVKDEAAFAKLKKELDENPASPKKAEESPSLKKGREKLATFVFR